MARPHENLHAWREAISLVKLTYLVTRSFPKEEVYGLSAQMRRAAISVPSNVAEGAARSSKKEFAQFISISKGSLSELETQVIIASELGYLPPRHEIFGHLERVGKLLTGLHKNVSK
jgi:four helix bundle protein